MAPASPSLRIPRSLSVALSTVLTLLLLLLTREAQASEPDVLRTPQHSLRMLLRDRHEAAPTLKVPRAAQAWLLAGGAASLVGGALAGLALSLGPAESRPRDLVTGVSSAESGPYVAAGLCGLLGGHLLTQIGVQVARRRHASLDRHFVLRTQLGVHARGFQVGVGGRF